MPKNIIEWSVYCEDESTYVCVLKYDSDGEPAVCPNNNTHTIDTDSVVEISRYSYAPEIVVKGEQELISFTNLHMNKNSVHNFRPVDVRIPTNKILEVDEVQLIWHESLEIKTAIVWEVRVLNPFYDPNYDKANDPNDYLGTYGVDVTVDGWFVDDQMVAVSQYFYKDLAELWSMGHRRPLSDGPTREMRHQFNDAFDKSNRKSFRLGGDNDVRIYVYAVTESDRRTDGEGTDYFTIDSDTVFYKPYTEQTITNGKYDSSLAASYDSNTTLSEVKQTDDCLTFLLIGTWFDNA